MATCGGTELDRGDVGGWGERGAAGSGGGGKLRLRDVFAGGAWIDGRGCVDAELKLCVRGAERRGVVCVSFWALLHCGDAESGGRALSSGDVQQRDGAGEHLAVPAVPCGDVLRRNGADRAERQLQRGLLLQRGLCGGERERVRRAYGVQRVELRGLRGRVSCGGVLSGGVSAADAVRGRAVLRDAGAVAGERAVRRRVLLWQRRGLEREAGRELGGVGALSVWRVLPHWISIPYFMSEGDVLWHGGQPERVRLSAVCCRVLLPVRWDEQRERVLVQRRVLLSGGDV